MYEQTNHTKFNSKNSEDHVNAQMVSHKNTESTKKREKKC